MKRKIEKTYGKTLQGIMFAVNPVKKKILKTHCTVHKFINVHAIDILKNEGYEDEYYFFQKHIKELNEGVTWADQDFKSSNHFYHYSKGTGLFGFSNALAECEKYYKKSVGYYKAGDVKKSLFYFGAACHLVQDATVPQHVNNKLLKSHRNFELWIIGRLMSDYSFIIKKGIIKHDALDKYIKNNAVFANETHLANAFVKDKDERYHKVATTIIKQAQKSTAGFMLNFYKDIK